MKVRLADARHAGDAEAQRLAGVRQQRVEQRVGARAVVGARRFEQRDRLGDRAPLRSPGAATPSSRAWSAGGSIARRGVQAAATRLADLLEHVLRARRDRRAGAVDALDAGVVEEVVVLRGITPPTKTTMSSAPCCLQRLDDRRHQRLVAGGQRETPTACTSFSIAWRAHSSGVWNSGPMSTSKPRSANAVATTLAPRSWPSWPSLAIITRGRRPCCLGEGGDLAPSACPSLRRCRRRLRTHRSPFACRRGGAPRPSPARRSPRPPWRAARTAWIAQVEQVALAAVARAAVSASSAACTAAASRVGAQLPAAARSGCSRTARLSISQDLDRVFLAEPVLVDADDHVLARNRCAPASRRRSPRSSAWPSRLCTALVMPPIASTSSMIAQAASAISCVSFSIM